MESILINEAQVGPPNCNTTAEGTTRPPPDTNGLASEGPQVSGSHVHRLSGPGASSMQGGRKETTAAPPALIPPPPGEASGPLSHPWGHSDMSQGYVFGYPLVNMGYYGHQAVVVNAAAPPTLPPLMNPLQLLLHCHQLSEATGSMGMAAESYNEAIKGRGICVSLSVSGVCRHNFFSFLVASDESVDDSFLGCVFSPLLYSMKSLTTPSI
jgi:hypothetical protein